MATIPFQTAFGSHRSCDLIFTDDDVSLTHQSFKDECDINCIMAKYQKTGLIEHVNTYEGNYGDFISAVDYHSAMNQVLAADDAFDSLPSSVRDQFSNNPADFLEFVHDPSNREKMIEMGLVDVPVDNVNIEPVVQNVSGSSDA